MLSIIFAICIFLMLKNSSIPYIFQPPVFISFIFDKPKSLFLVGLAQMIDIFASAFVTSLLFYYMVDYLPNMKQEKKANEIISPKLERLFLYISELLAIIEYSAKQEKLLQAEDFDMLDKLHFQNKDVLCKKKSFKNEIENGTAPYSYNLLKDGDKFRTLILNICGEITSAPSFLYCETQVIHIISEIQLSELLHILPKPSDPLLQFNISDAITYMGVGKGYLHLNSINKELAQFISTRLSCEMIDISKEEIEEWKQGQEEFIKQNPQVVPILNALYK